MSKRNKLRKQVEQLTATEIVASAVPLTLGGHTFRVFQAIDAAFGARLADYPPMSSVPDGATIRPYVQVASGLFFNGGALQDYGLKIKASLDRSQVTVALRALLSSWDPKHEHKEAVVAWALSEWCDGTPTRKAGA